MPLEKSLNDPLTCVEIKEIILAKVKKALDGNPLLADDITYPFFGFKFDGTLIFPGRSTLIWDQKGNQEGVKEPVHMEYQSPDSPNLAREQNGLPTPVMVQTPSGMEKRRVKYGQ